MAYDAGKTVHGTETMLEIANRGEAGRRKVMLKVDISVEGIQINIKNLEAVKRRIGNAAITALNETGKLVKDELREQMTRVFDRPTPYTLNALYVKRATAEKPAVTIAPRMFAGKGTVPEKYLWPQVFGGDRNLKRHEQALKRIGILPPGMYAVPGSAAQLDAYGNMSRGQIIQILAYFKAFGEQGYRANITEKGKAKLKRGTKKKRGMEYFAVISQRSHLKRGIYQKVSFGFGKAIRPVMMFIKSPSYRKRYEFGKIAEAKAKQVFRGLYLAALNRAE